MRVADLMETNVETVDIRMPAEDAWRRMHDHDLALLLVADGTDLRGVVPREHLDGADGRDNREGRTLEAFVRPGCVTLTPECTANHAADLLDGVTSGCVAVLERGHLVGVVTTSGLLRRLGARGRSRGDRTEAIDIVRDALATPARPPAG